jgi:cell division protein FtsB
MKVNFSKVLSVGAATLFLALVVFQAMRGFTTQTTVLSVVLVLLAFYKDSEFNRNERKELEEKAAATKAELEARIDKLSEELSAKERALIERLEFTHSQINSLKISAGIKSRSFGG